LVPIYLLHRYQVEAVAKSLGGLYFTHAVKNDGEEPTKMVEPAEQWRAFDPIAVAEAAAENTLSYLLNSERAARLIEYQARDERQPGLLPVLDKLIDKTWKTSLQPGYKGELQLLVDNLTLKHLL